MEKLNKLSLPVTILIASIILGGFYYSSEANKQASIEKQQQIELQAKKDQEDLAAMNKSREAFQKSLCVTTAQQIAINEYKNSYSCTGAYPSNDCNNGTYLVPQYNYAYDTCLQSKGLK